MDVELIEGSQQQQDQRHESQLADLDADIEQQQSQRNVTLRQTEADEPAGEAQAMDQAEGEGDQPWLSQRQAGAARRARSASTPTNMIDNAMAAFNGGAGTCT